MFPAEPLPDQIGAYRIIRRLPDMASHEVYLARSEGPLGFQRDVALKIMPDTTEGNAQLAEEMSREASICSRLNHPAIVRVVDFFEQTGKIVLVLEHIEGTSLEQLLHAVAAKNERLSDEACYYIVQQVAGALAYAHSAIDDADKPTPIIHRNLHPDNILLSEDGDVRLTGFGVGKILGRTPDTAIGKIKGTPGFMAPEQARGEPVTTKADVFGLGILLWSLLTGTRPPTDGTWPRKIKTLRSDLPREVVAIIDAALDPFPGTRKITSREIEQWLSKVSTRSKGQADVKERVAAISSEQRLSQEPEPPPVEGRIASRQTDPGLGGLAGAPNPFQGVRFGAPGAGPQRRPSTTSFRAVTLDRDAMGPEAKSPVVEKTQQMARSALLGAVATVDKIEKDLAGPRRTVTSSFRALPPPPPLEPEPPKPAAPPRPAETPKPDIHRVAETQRPPQDDDKPRSRRRINTPAPPESGEERSESAVAVIPARASRPGAEVERVVVKEIAPAPELTPPPGPVRFGAPPDPAPPVATPAPPAITFGPAPGALATPVPMTIGFGPPPESSATPSINIPTATPPIAIATPAPASIRFRPPLDSHLNTEGLMAPPGAGADAAPPTRAGKRSLSAGGTVLVSALTATIVVALALYFFWPTSTTKPPAPVASASAVVAPPIVVASAPPSPPTAAPSASAAPAVDAASDPSLLSYGYGYLTVVSPASANVYVWGKLVGPVNTPIKVKCGRFFVRLAAPNEGKYPDWVTAGETVTVACQQTTKIEMKP